MGSDGGGIDLNLDTPDPLLSAIRSENPRLMAADGQFPESRSEKDVLVAEEDMKGFEKETCDDGRECESTDVSKLPEEEAIKNLRERERGRERERERENLVVGAKEEEAKMYTD